MNNLSVSILLFFSTITALSAQESIEIRSAFSGKSGTLPELFLYTDSTFYRERKIIMEHLNEFALPFFEPDRRFLVLAKTDYNVIRKFVKKNNDPFQSFDFPRGPSSTLYYIRCKRRHKAVEKVEISFERDKKKSIAFFEKMLGALADSKDDQLKSHISGIIESLKVFELNY